MVDVKIWTIITLASVLILCAHHITSLEILVILELQTYYYTWASFYIHVIIIFLPSLIFFFDFNFGDFNII